MLKELRNYHNLGTPNYFFELFRHINREREIDWTKSDLKGLFYNTIIDGQSIFDGCIELAIAIKAISIEGSNISINRKVKDNLGDVDQMSEYFINLLFKSLKKDKIFSEIFSPSNLSFDIIHKSLQISNSAFSFKYANFKQLLLNFHVLRPHPRSQIRIYLINNKFKPVFDKFVLPEINKKPIGIDQLNESLELKRLYGEQAEKFVVEFEQKRLNFSKEIYWIAQYVVNEGYDIASFNNINDLEPNRFIEVKSYEGNKPYFFWSRNEYSTAKRKQNEYWIYLVNRNKIGVLGYEPIMEQNPYKNILNQSEWMKQIENYKIEKIT